MKIKDWLLSLTDSPSKKRRAKLRTPRDAEQRTRRRRTYHTEGLEERCLLTPVIEVNGISQMEFGPNHLTDIQFAVRLTEPSATEVTVDFETIAGSATEVEDYSAVNRTTLRFEPGQTVRTITVPVRGDGAVEGHETFILHLSRAVGANFPDNEPSLDVTGTILNDDVDGSASTLLAGQDSSELTGGIVDAFRTIRKRIQTVVVAAGDLPVVGDQIIEGIQPFLDDLEQYESNLSDRIEGIYSGLGAGTDPLVEALREGIFEIFGSSGLDILQDGPDSDGDSSLTDIVLTFEEGQSVQFDFHLGQSTFFDLDFSIGSSIEDLLPVFDFQIDASDGIRFDLGWDLYFGFGYDASDGFYLNADAQDDSGESVPELSAGIDVYAAPPTDLAGNSLLSTESGINADVSLGLLHAHFEDGTQKRVTLTGLQSLGVSPFDEADFSNTFDLIVEYEAGADPEAPDKPVLQTHTISNITHQGGNQTITTFLAELNAEINARLHESSAPEELRAELFPISVRPTFSDGESSLQFVARTPIIKSLSIRGDEIHKWGFNGLIQHDDNRAIGLGFDPGQTSSGSGPFELVAVRAAPVDGQAVTDTELMIQYDGGAIVPVRIRASELENVGSMEEYADIIQMAIRSALTAEGIDATAVFADFAADEPRGDRKLRISSPRPITVSYSTKDRTGASILIGVDMTDPDNDGRLTVSEIAENSSSLPDLFEYVLEAKAEVRAHIDASMDLITGALEQALGLTGGTIGLPELAYDLKLDAGISIDSSEPGQSLEPEISLRFDNVMLDVGSVLETIVQPIANVVGETLGPVADVLGDGVDATRGFINDPIPLVSDLVGGDVTILDLAPNGDTISEFLGQLSAVLTMGSSLSSFLESYDGRPISFGCFEFDADARLLLPCEVTDTISEFAASPEDGPDSTAPRSPQDFLQEFAAISGRTGGFSLDVIAPESILNMLVGEPFDIVSFNLPQLDTSLGLGFEFDFEVLQAHFDVGADIFLDLGIAYDSTGIERIIDAFQADATPDWTDLLDGFYIRTRDGNEVRVGLSASGGGAVGPVAGVWPFDPVFDARADISIEGGVGLDLFDPNEDGHLRLDELLYVTDNFSHPENILCMFDIGVDAAFDFNASVTVLGLTLGTDDLPFPTSFDFELSAQEIFGALGFNCDERIAPLLATPIAVDGGTALRINAGAFAADRLFGDTDDSSGANVNVSGNSSSIIVEMPTLQSGSATQTFSGSFTKVIVVGADGEDVFDLSGLSGVPVDARGGKGDDTISGGSAGDLLMGGPGNDTLTGNGGNDDIQGEGGDDTLNGNDGNDQISGDTGIDTIDGGDGDDLLLGGRDDDTIHGGPGNDEVQGGSGDDTLNGDAGDDRLFGESGDDTINDGDDDDTVNGGPGADTLNGGAGADNLSGGTGNDTIEGGFDTDPDVVSGDEGNDTVSGQIGDRLYGRTGSDTILARPGTAWADGGTGRDELSFHLASSLGGDGPAAAELREDRLIASTGTTIFTGIESIHEIQFGSGDETLTINGLPGNVRVLMGQGDDTLIVKSSRHGSVITVDGQLDDRIFGEAGDRLIIDRSNEITPLAGAVGGGQASGLGIGDILYERIEQVNVLLGSGSDRLTVNGTDRDDPRYDVHLHRVDGGGGDDEIRVVPSNSELQKRSTLELLGGPGNDTAVITFNDPSAVDANSLSDWSLAAEVLRIEDPTTGRSADNWSLTDRTVQLGGTTILDVSAIRSVEFAADSDGQDSFHLTSTTNETKRIAIEGDQIEVEGGQEILRPLSFLSEVDISIVPNFQVDGLEDANGVAVSDNGRFLFVSGGVGTDGFLTVYQRHPTTGQINLQEVQRDFVNPDQIVYVPDPNPADQKDTDVLLLVQRFNGFAVLSGVEVDRATGELNRNTGIALAYNQIHGFTLAPDEPGVIYVSGELSTSQHVVQRLSFDLTGVVVESTVHMPQSSSRRAPLASPDGEFVYWVNDDGSEFRTYSVNGSALNFERTTDLRSFVGTDLSVVSAAFVPDPTLPTEYRIWALEQNTNQLLNIAVTRNSGTVTFASLTGSSANLNITEGNEIAFRDRNRLYFTQTQSTQTVGTLSLNSNGLPFGNVAFREGEQRGLAVASDDMVYSVQDSALSHSTVDTHRRYAQNDSVTTPLSEHFTDVAAGPDGDVYAISEQDSALVQLRRNSLTGELEQVKAIVDGFGRNEGLYFPSSVTVSDDGLQVFVTSPLRNKIGVFVKDSPTGGLRFASSVDYTGAKKVAFSNHNDFSFGAGPLLYAIGSASDSFSVFRVTAGGTLEAAGSRTAIGLNGGQPHDIAVISQSGFNAVVSTTLQDVGGNGRVATWSRETIPESLPVDDPLKIVIADHALGRFYVASGSDRRIHTFDFGPTPHSLVKLAEIDTIPGLTDITDMAITPDNRFLAVLSSADNAIVLFRHANTGSGLEFVQRFTDSPEFRGLEMPTSLDVLPGTTALGRPTWQFLTGSLGDSLNPGGLATFTADLQGQPAQANSNATDGVPLNLRVGTMESTITFDRFVGNVGDVDVSLDLSNLTSDDIRAILVSPSGTEVELFSNLGATELSQTNLDDQAPELISRQSAPYSGRFRPAGSLADFNGEDPNGVWRLRIIDASKDPNFSGVLNDWSLNVSSDVSSEDTPVTVPGGGPRGESVIDFNGAPGQIEDVSVTVTVRGFANGMGRLTLTSPTGTFLVLTPLPDADYVRATFDDTADQSASASSGAYTGVIRPQDPLGELRGEAGNGRWTLHASSGPTEDVVIESWSLNVRFSDADSYFVSHSGFGSVTVTSGNSTTGTGNADRVNIVSPAVANLTVNTLGGQDTVTIAQQGDANTTINLGDDSDSFSLLMPSSTGMLSVSAGDGNDTINAYTIGPGVTQLDGGEGDDTYRVDLDRIADGAEATVNGADESTGDLLNYVTGGAATIPVSPAFPGDDVEQTLSLSGHGTLKYREIEGGAIPAVATVQITADPISEGNDAQISASTSGGGNYSWDLNGDGIFGDRTGPSLLLNWNELSAFGINDGPAQYPVSVRLEDNGQFAFDTALLTVNDVAPTLNIDGPDTVNEADVYQLNLSADDPGDDRVTEWIVDWGDGSPFEIFNAASVTATHVYADDDVLAPSTFFTIFVRATDDGNVVNQTTSVTVLDVADLKREFDVTTTTIQEAESVTVNFIADGPPGFERPARWLVNWGDGTEVMVLPGTATNATHVYADDGTFEVSVMAQERTGVAASEAFAQTHVVANSADGAVDVHVADLDLDGDLDVLSASVFNNTIAWHENDGNANFTDHEIDTAAIDARSVFAADLDGDGDVDVVSASPGNDTVAWYRNNGDGTFSDAIVITDFAIGAYSVTAADVDSDGDLDILSSSTDDNTIRWYENDGALFPQFTVRVISKSAISPRIISATDMDRDGDMDVLIAIAGENTIAWYENDGQQGFTAHAISRTVVAAWHASAVDLDGDGDIDVLSAAHNGNEIVWHENNGKQDFTDHLITDTADGVLRVFAVDLDGDADLDVVSSSFDDHLVAWYENNGSQRFKEKHIINDAGLPVEGLAVADIDRDGDIDLLSSVPHGGQVLWHENVIGSGDLLPATPATGQQTVDGAIVVNVANVDPVLTALITSATIAEGQSTALNLSHADVGDDRLIGWTIDWGDGTVQTVPGNSTTVAHTYGDDGTFTVQVVARDEDGTYTVLSNGQVVVSDVLPTLSISLADGSTANEGDLVRLLLDSDDPGRDIISRWIVDWGDGTVETIERPDGRATSRTHVYADGNQTHTIRVTAIDVNDTPDDVADDLQFTSDEQAASITVQVLDVAASPSLVVDRSSRPFSRGTTGAETLVEGDSFSVLLSANDPGVDRITEWQIDWDGDGNIDQTEPVATDHRILVRISDSRVILEGDGRTQLHFDYSEPLESSGVGGNLQPSLFGLGTGGGGGASFDDLLIQEFGNPSNVLITEDFNDGVASGFSIATGTWLTQDDQYRGAPTGATALSTLGAFNPLPVATPVEFDLARLTQPGEVVTSYTIEWGDGDTETITVPDGQDEFHTADLLVKHAYRNGTNEHAVRITLGGPSPRVVDITALTATREPSLLPTVTRTLPSLPLRPDISEYSINWGDRYIYDDQLDEPATVDRIETIEVTYNSANDEYQITWPDGREETLPPTAPLDFEHVYAAAGLFPITVRQKPTSGDAVIFFEETVLVGVEGLHLEFSTSVDFAGATDGQQPLALVVFDYVDANNFKYAGIRDDGTQRTWVIGHHDENGFHHDAMRTEQVVARVKPLKRVATFNDGNLQQHSLRASDVPRTFNNEIFNSDIVIEGEQNPLVDSPTVLNVGGTIRDVNVIVDFQHEDLSTLQLDLVAPGGATFRLVNTGDLAGENLTGLRFDDEGTDAINPGMAPYRGRFRPAESLSALDGETAHGTWQLRVTNSGGTEGELKSWTLELTTQDKVSSDAPSIFDVRATAVGPSGSFDTTPLQITVLNKAPRIDVSGPAEAQTHQSVKLTLESVTDPGDDTVTGYEVYWGDSGVPVTVGAHVTTVSHEYALGGWYPIHIAAIDEDGTHLAAGFHSIDILGPAIGINFVGGGSGQPGARVSTAEITGFFPQRNWNDVADNGIDESGAQAGALTGLRDSDGTLTDISVKWEAAHTGAYDGTDIPADGNAELYKGYLFSDGITPTTITISDIAYLQYDVYVYSDAPAPSIVFLNAVDGVVNPLQVTINDFSNWPITTGGRHFFRGAFGNHAVFRGLVGPDVTVSVDLSSIGGVLNAVQIVPTLPELIVNSTDDINDNDPWNASMTLREALFLANDTPGHNTIRFDPVVFSIPQTITLANGEFPVTDELTIDGPGLDLLTIDAQQNSRILNVQVPSGDVAIDGLKLINGQVTGSGGAISVGTGSTITISNTQISENTATVRGGGIFTEADASITISDSHISDNTSLNNGGGILLNSGSTLVLTDSEVSGNSSREGGGIRLEDDDVSVTVERSTIHNNQATFPGGGVSSGSRNVLNISNSTISGNTSSFVSSGFGGGGVFGFQTTVIIDSSTISGNTAAGPGGGVQSKSGGTLLVRNSTITGNRAGSDDSDSKGGGIETDLGIVTLHNTIVAGNLAAFAAASDLSGTVSSGSSFNLIGDPATSGGLTHGNDGNIVGQDDGMSGRRLLDTNSVLGPLTENGGPTLTHALIVGSPAIDAGDPATSSGTDQRGIARVIDGDRNGSAGVDIGAFEVLTESLDMDRNGVADAATDGILIIRYLFGFRGDTLINGAIGDSAAHTTAESVELALSAAAPIFDADGNGIRDAATDGILIIRYLFGFRETALASGAIGEGPARSTGAQVAAFLDGFSPPAPPPPEASGSKLSFRTLTRQNAPPVASLPPDYAASSFTEESKEKLRDLFPLDTYESPIDWSLLVVDEDDGPLLDQQFEPGLDWLSLI